jgi:hypothetical protein
VETESPPFNTDAILHVVKQEIERQAAAVKRPGGSGFSPNKLSEPLKEGPAGKSLGDPECAGGKTFEPGYPGESVQHWDGVKSPNAPTHAKGIDEAQIRKICGDVVQEALADLFAEGLLTKAVTSGSAQAAVQNLLKGAIAGATSEFEARLAKVEDAAVPSKGIQNTLNLVEKGYALNPAERQVVEGAVQDVVSKMSDSDQILSVAQFLHKFTYAQAPASL